MKCMVIPAFVVSIALWPVVVSADEVSHSFWRNHADFLRLLDSDRTVLKIGYTYQPSTAEENGPGEFNLKKIDYSIADPYPVSPDLFLRAGLEYEARVYNFKKVPGALTEEESETLHKIVLNLGVGYFMSPDVLLTGILETGGYSDFDKKLTGDDFRIFGRLTAVFQTRRDRQWLFGLAVSEDFDETEIFPLLGMRTSLKGGKLLINATLPLEVRADYLLSYRNRLYAGVWISGDEYHARLGPQDSDLNIQVHERRAGLGIEHSIYNGLQLILEGGYLFESKLEFKRPNAGQFSGDLESSPYFSIGITFSI